MKTLKLLSPAKINLILRILSVRNDGYHNIKSLIQPVNLFDEVSIEVSQGSSLKVQTHGIQFNRPEDNIAYRAARLYLEKSAVSRSVNITIRKNIPAGAGLGGGSSNAAAVLAGLNRLIGALSDSELLDISPLLGADVAVLINPVTSLVEGIGEKVTPLYDFPLLHYVIAWPGTALSTKQVYQKWDTLNTGRKNTKEFGSKDTDILFAPDCDIGTIPLVNDLEESAFIICPEAGHLKKLMISLNAESVQMTGSGSAVFAAFRDERSADDLYEYLDSSETFSVFRAEGINGWYKLVT